MKRLLGFIWASVWLVIVTALGVSALSLAVASIASAVKVVRSAMQ